MKISFEKPESFLIAEEKTPRPYCRHQTDIFDEAFPVLYDASKFGEIELLDALVASRHHATLIALFARNCSTVDDIDVVKTVLARIKQDKHEYVDRRPDNFVLANWLKRNKK